MSTKHKISSEEIAAIQEARKQNKDKRVEQRLRALAECAKGKRNREIASICGFHPRYISTLVTKYLEGVLEAITGNHYGGNHRNMSVEDEAALLEQFRAKAQEGKLIEVSY